MQRRFRLFSPLFAIALAVVVEFAWSGEIVRVADIEPLSGAPAAIGKWWDNHVQMAVDQVNAKGGVLGGRKIELVPFDSKSSPQEALIALKAVTDQIGRAHV